MPDDLKSRARASLLGLAIGDALGSPTENKSREAIGQRWGQVMDFLSEGQAGSDDTEYAMFNARLLLKYGPRISAALIAEEWRREIVSVSNSYRGAGFSEMMAIRNLKSGLLPPQSGQHLHAWSDGLAMRVAPFGIVAVGNPVLAAHLAEMDGSVTHAGEGIYAGKAVAAAVATAMGGAPVPSVIDAAREAIPGDSWTKRAIDRAVVAGAKSRDVWNALAPLEHEVVFDRYFWSDLGPEAVALALGLVVASRGNFRDAVLGAVNVGRDTDTIAAIAGAITGALQGTVPEEWARRVSVVAGTCIGVVKGMDIRRTADQLVQLSRDWEAKQ